MLLFPILATLIKDINFQYFMIVFVILDLLVLYYWGLGDLSKLRLSGEYEVGHTEFRSSEYKNPVSVYYPICKSVKDNHANPYWQKSRDKAVHALARCTADNGGNPEDHMHPDVFKFVKSVKLEVAEDAPLHGDFACG